MATVRVDHDLRRDGRAGLVLATVLHDDGSFEPWVGEVGAGVAAAAPAEASVAARVAAKAAAEREAEAAAVEASAEVKLRDVGLSLTDETLLLAGLTQAEVDALRGAE
jgi:hypothetical protein